MFGWRTFAGLKGLHGHIVAVCKLLCRHDVYNLFRYFPYIHDAGYDKEFKDVRDGRMLLSRGVFEWLVSIRPSYLVYRSEDTCYVEPYIPAGLLVSSDMTNSILAI